MPTDQVEFIMPMRSNWQVGNVALTMFTSIKEKNGPAREGPTSNQEK